MGEDPGNEASIISKLELVIVTKQECIRMGGSSKSV